MRKYSRFKGVLFCCFAIAAAIVLMLPGTADAASGVATVDVSQVQITWAPVAQSQGGVLLVRGPNGYMMEHQFGASDKPVLAVAGLAEGQYVYELRLSPTIPQHLRDAMAKARERGGRAEDAGALPEPMILNGAFRIAKGSIIAGNGPAEVRNDPAKDIHHSNTTIHDSLCVGYDCANPETFGYDTIRVKENNVRFHFDDTSTVAGYPNTDWRLTANDSTSGGLGRFSIEDASDATTPFTIEADAGSNAIYVDDYGRVGFGTSIPYVELHSVDGDTPTLRLQQDSSSGFSAQTWDVAGNESNFFIRDVTHASALPFRIQPGAPTSSLTIRDSGNVGIGTWSPDKALDLEDDGPSFRLTNTGTGGGTWDFKVNGSNGRLNITDDSAATRVPIKVDPGSDNNLLRIGIVASDQIDIDGDLVVTGTITPDYVFDSSYQLESIEEHAAFMWRERHLPAVAPATPAHSGKHQINVGARAQGVLEELEKAHIYIEQLNDTVKSLATEVADKDATIIELKQQTQDLAQRLAELEARIR